MRVLITGVAGFAGTHLTEFLSRQKDVEIFGIVRQDTSLEALEPFKSQVKLLWADMTDRDAVKEALRKAAPERIFHLAAQSSVMESLKSPALTVEANIRGQLNIFESLRELRLDALVHIASSAEVYGQVSGEKALSESLPLKPANPYAVSKAAQELLAYQYLKTYGLKSVVTRAFNHTGPGQSPRFVASGLARQVAAIEAGRQKPVLRTGNLDLVRDFTDVRDIVRAYWLALEKGEPGETYNLCSGVGRILNEILAIYLKHSMIKIDVLCDPALLRANDLPLMVGDPSQFNRRTGWAPKIPFESTLMDVLNYWRRKIAS